MHISVAKLCIEHKVHLITTSYTSPEMAALSDKAAAAGVTILNEVGLDPGLDHLTAMKVIRDVSDKGGQVTSYKSWCGGLPAPEVSDNPLAYKFSWAPRGALLAGLNGALYIDGGRTVEHAPGTAFQHTEPVTCWPGFNLEGYPNRNSVQYAQDYGIPAARRFFRGTLRYKNTCQVLNALVTLGYVNPARNDMLVQGAKRITWRELSLLLMPDLTTYDLESGALRKLGLQNEDAAHVEEALEWLGVFSSSLVVPQKGSTLDALCELMVQKMGYAKGERDLVILRHEFEMTLPGGKSVRKSSSLVRYGDPDGHSAMATLVGMPAGIATKLVLDGHIIRRGVLRPLTPDIFRPMLTLLEEEGIRMEERSLD